MQIIYVRRSVVSAFARLSRHLRDRGTALAVVLLVIASSAGLLLRAESPQAVGTWASLGNTPDSRVGAAAVGLPDGRTLITGGTVNGAPTDSVVIFSPANGSFTSGGNLQVPRVGHTATLLDDGRVLIAGGTSNALVSADLELFDPVAHVSVLGGAMVQPRTGHAASKLSDGRVLIVGGSSTQGVLQSAELFDPASATTTILQPMSSPRTGASATTLIDGHVLIAGGNNGTRDLATAEIFDASSQTFTATPSVLSTPRSGHTAILLAHNNAVLIAGGTSAGVAVSNADLFLPAIPVSSGPAAFARAQSMPSARTRAVGGQYGDGYAFVAGGGVADASVYRFATINTDKSDYAAGETVTITGSGWQTGKVTVVVEEASGDQHVPVQLNAIADPNGNFSAQFSPQSHLSGVRHYASGFDSRSRATSAFTAVGGEAAAAANSAKGADHRAVTAGGNLVLLVKTVPGLSQAEQNALVARGGGNEKRAI